MDSGLRSAAQNIALDRALLEARQADEISSTLRFTRFARSALLACRQSAAQEFDLDNCNAANIAVQRRISSGEAVYCDEGQLGWALYLHQCDVGTTDMHAIAKRICHAAAAAVSALGVDARFRARHDIEIDGRKLGGAGGACDGDALLYQGVLQIDQDVATLMRTMRTPAGASGQAIAAACERVTDLKTALGARPDVALIKSNMIAAFESEFGVELHDGDLSLTEHARYQNALAEIDTRDWVNLMRQPASAMPVCAAAHMLQDGVLNAELIYDRTADRIKQVWFECDKACKPRRVIADLEAALADTAVERLEQNVRAFFAGRAVDMPVLTSGDFISVVRRALKLPVVAQNP
jgi:lipoate-protein ligase A